MICILNARRRTHMVLKQKLYIYPYLYNRIKWFSNVILTQNYGKTLFSCCPQIRKTFGTNAFALVGNATSYLRIQTLIEQPQQNYFQNLFNRWFPSYGRTLYILFVQCTTNHNNAENTTICMCWVTIGLAWHEWQGDLVSTSHNRQQWHITENFFV